MFVGQNICQDKQTWGGRGGRVSTAADSRADESTFRQIPSLLRTTTGGKKVTRSGRFSSAVNRGSTALSPPVLRVGRRNF